MSEHNYQTGQLVKRISTRERAFFVSSQTGTLRVKISDVTGYPTYSWWPDFDCRPVVDDDTAEELSECRSVLHYIDEGHTAHCAKRMTYGDGECECGKSGNGCDTIAVVSLKEELAAKDARIAELESIVEGLADEMMTPYLLGVEHGKDVLRKELAAEKDAYHKLANEAQGKYTQCGVLEHENDKLRNLCGEAEPFLYADSCDRMGERVKMAELRKKLRAAAEGGE